MSSDHLQSIQAEPGDLPSPPSTRAVGRPRRLTLTQLLDAAIEMGLDGLRMATLAKHLGVSPAVLYTYVSGRTELVRLAAQRASGAAAFPEDTGQSWRDFVIQYAEAHYRLVEEGQLISTLLNGDLAPATKLDSAEQWLQVMLNRGFTLAAALDLLRSVDVIVLGGALSSAYAQAVAGGEAEYRELVQTSVAQRCAHDLPILSEHAEPFASSDISSWRTALTLLLDGITAQRGE